MSFGRKFSLESGFYHDPNSLRLLVNELKSSLNCLVICLSHSWGGLEQVAVNDSLDAAALGLKIQFLCLEGSPVHEHLAARTDLTVLPLTFQPRNYFDLKLRTELNRLIAEGVNLIHTHQTSFLGSLAPWLWPHRSVSLLATRHIMNNHNKKDFFHRSIYGRVDYLIVMSHTLQVNVLKTHAIAEKKVKVVNLGLDFDLFNPEKVNPAHQRSLWGATPDTVTIGLVGRIDLAKGQGTFIKAAAGLLKNPRSTQKLKFIIVGEETLGSPSHHYLDELKKMVVQFHLENYIVFAGYQKNIPEVMRSFDIFVMPSKQEAFGLVAIEAMAMEVPIIISSGGSAEEIVGKENFGLIMRPSDAFDLQRQLRYLLDHPAERVQMGQKARVHVQAFYDRQKRIVKTLALYGRALKRRGVIA